MQAWIHTYDQQVRQHRALCMGAGVWRKRSRGQVEDSYGVSAT
jgi:hypothetical protein